MTRNSAHPYRISIVGGSASGKSNALLSLINDQPDIDKTFFYMLKIHMKHLLITKRESKGFKYLNDYKSFIEYSNDMDDI